MAANLLMQSDNLTLEQQADYNRHLEEVLDDFTLVNEDSVSAFKAYIDSNYVVLPFSGGWLEQPSWVKHDFDLLKALLEYHYRNLQRPNPDKGNGL